MPRNSTVLLFFILPLGAACAPSTPPIERTGSTTAHLDGDDGGGDGGDDDGAAPDDSGMRGDDDDDAAPDDSGMRGDDDTGFEPKKSQNGDDDLELPEHKECGGDDDDDDNCDHGDDPASAEVQGKADLSLGAVELMKMLGHHP
jgi:hypothetical protein